MTLRQIAVFVAVSSLIVAAGPSRAADDEMKKLEIFSDVPLEKGLWRMEILESSDPRIVESSAKMGKAAICMDVAKEIAEGGVDKGDEESDDGCKQTIVRNTASVGEIEVVCEDGDKTTVAITKEGPKVYLFESKRIPGSDETAGDVGGAGGPGGARGSVVAKAETMKGRYTYQGPCKGDALIQMDRDSEACQQMRAQMGPGGAATMCAQVPAEHRAECEKRMKSLTSMCE
jgi:hypothetical protein